MVFQAKCINANGSKTLVEGEIYNVYGVHLINTFVKGIYVPTMDEQPFTKVKMGIDNYSNVQKRIFNFKRFMKI